MALREADAESGDGVLVGDRRLDRVDELVGSRAGLWGLRRRRSDPAASTLSTDAPSDGAAAIS